MTLELCFAYNLRTVLYKTLSGVVTYLVNTVPYMSNFAKIRNYSLFDTDANVLAKKRSGKLWEYFEKDRSDKSIPKAVCKVLVSGHPCGLVLMTKQYNTSTLRSHLNAKHPAIFKKVVTFEQAWDDARSRAKKDLSKFFYVV